MSAWRLGARWLLVSFSLFISACSFEGTGSPEDAAEAAISALQSKDLPAFLDVVEINSISVDVAEATIAAMVSGMPPSVKQEAFEKAPVLAEEFVTEVTNAFAINSAFSIDKYQLEIGSIEQGKSGNEAIIPLTITQNEGGRSYTLRFAAAIKTESGEGRGDEQLWKITRVLNYSDLLKQAAILRAEERERQLAPIRRELNEALSLSAIAKQAVTKDGKPKVLISATANSTRRIDRATATVIATDSDGAEVIRLALLVSQVPAGMQSPLVWEIDVPVPDEQANVLFSTPPSELSFRASIDEAVIDGRTVAFPD
ncbi:hypothetical protein A3709_20435 [Halioglobus sp. HI00S01]|uniref:hypothetical protein n=1 Tax=Halioglobus sp. HI00S01 TaxID=1822214 RepID=UPI0007C2A6EB|nr:hypothetical protein [Halioglobus sp. HI00S01]KZX57981.1 hypothetical protein A3709_20435 [Halioglobus sp. HI00S01]